MVRARVSRFMAAAGLCLMVAPNLAFAGFDCAKAYLRVDFVICRSDQAMQAEADLSSAWDLVRSTVTPDRKMSLVAEQRSWIQTYSADCGLSGHGAVAPDSSGQTDRCVIDRIRRRMSRKREGSTMGKRAARMMALTEVP